MTTARELIQNGEYWVVRNDQQKANVAEFISGIPANTSQPFVVKIDSKQEPRTLRQNRYLWGWVYKNIALSLEDSGIVIPLEDGSEMPYDAEILHEVFKKRFLVVETKNAKKKDGSTVEIPIYRSTRNLNKQQFTAYLEDIKRFVYQLWKISVQDPTQGYWANYYKELGLTKGNV